MEELLKAIDELFNNYDAFFINNKYSSTENLEDNTHEKEFKLLIDKFKNDEISMRAIKWILNCYDCYLKDEFMDDGTAFEYLRRKIREEL